MKALILSIMIIGTFYSSAQAQPITWQRIYGATSHFTARSGIQTYDGGYLFASSGSGLILTKVNLYGAVEWEKFYVYGWVDMVLQTKDSGFIMCGIDASIFATDKNGDSLWYRAYGGTIDSHLWSIVEYYDGGYISCGYKYNGAFVVRIDSVGNLIWQKEINDENYFAYDLIWDSNYNIAVTGFAHTTRDDLFILKLNSNGTLYRKVFSNPPGNRENGRKIIRSYDGGYAISGAYINYFNYPLANSHLSFYDSSGAIINKMIFADETYRVEKSQDSNSYVLVGGKYISPNHFPPLCFKKVDLQGNEIWTRLVENAPFWTLVRNIEMTIDGGYFCVGYYYDTVSQDYSRYAIKTDSACRADNPVGISGSPVNIIKDFNLYPAYPNPFNSGTKIKFEVNEHGIYRLELFDITGKTVKEIFNKNYSPGSYTISLQNEFQSSSSSVYFLKLSSTTNFQIQRLVYLK